MKNVDANKVPCLNDIVKHYDKFMVKFNGKIILIVDEIQFI